jgi:hypothetical protein
VRLNRRFDLIRINIEKVKVEDAKEHCKMMIDLENERLELDKKTN